MSDDLQPGSEQLNDDVSPVNLWDIEFRLKYGDQSGHPDAVRELLRYGTQACTLAPLVAELYRAKRLTLAMSALSELFRATRAPDLLAILKEGDTLAQLPTDEQCRLLDHGVTEVESSLVVRLYKDWHNPESWHRLDIVKCLGRSGSSESFKLLCVIAYRLAEDVAVQLAGLDNANAIDCLPPPLRRQIGEVTTEGRVDPAKCAALKKDVDVVAFWIDRLESFVARVPEDRWRRHKEMLMEVRNSLRRMLERGVTAT